MGMFNFKPQIRIKIPLLIRIVRQAFSDPKITAADCRMHRNATFWDKNSKQNSKPHPPRRLRRLDLAPRSPILDPPLTM